MEARQIDITKQNINCCEELLVCDDYINATYELWFDVDKYFGTNINNEDTTSWINFYTDWYPDGKIKAYYHIDGDLTTESVEWELTEDEQRFFEAKMEEYCYSFDGKCLLELLEEYNESEED